MCGVMCLHTQAKYIDTPIAHFLYITSVFSIPLFFMTSGYLLLGKGNVNYKYSSKKIIGILRFVFIMTILIYLVSGLHHGTSFLNATVSSLIQRGQLGVFWYLGAMIIIYVLLPALDYLYRQIFKLFMCLCIFLLLFSSTVFALNFIGGIHIEQNTIQTFRLWNWLFYFCLRGILKRYPFRVNGYAVMFLIIANYLFQIHTTEYIGNEFCEYYYPSLPVMLLSVSVFQLLLGVKKRNLSFVNGGGKLFLPCYTIHSLIIGKTINAFNNVFSSTDMLRPVLYLIFICSLSIVLSWYLMKIPFAQKIFRI